MDKKHPLYFTIHGHFYQPPRENPWTGVIENQPSARPNHDWNDRIASQCYSPNSASRILSPHGHIVDIVNNYEYMSFNMGNRGSAHHGENAVPGLQFPLQGTDTPAAEPVYPEQGGRDKQHRIEKEHRHGKIPRPSDMDP